MAKTLSTRYAATKARANRAYTAIERAEKHLIDRLLTQYPNGDAPYTEDAVVMAAQDIFKKCSALNTADVNAARKREGIGDYVPYGHKITRRW